MFCGTFPKSGEDGAERTVFHGNRAGAKASQEGYQIKEKGSGRRETMSRALYNASDIALDLSIPLSESEKLLNELNRRMKHRGFYTIKDMIPRAYYEKQKESGFMQDTDIFATKIPVSEKRLLKMEEFCEYAGDICIQTARKYVKEIGAEVKIGGRCFVDREKFEHWCDTVSC